MPKISVGTFFKKVFRNGSVTEERVPFLPKTLARFVYTDDGKQVSAELVKNSEEIASVSNTLDEKISDMNTSVNNKFDEFNEEVTNKFTDVTTNITNITETMGKLESGEIGSAGTSSFNTFEDYQKALEDGTASANAIYIINDDVENVEESDDDSDDDDDNGDQTDPTD